MGRVPHRSLAPRAHRGWDRGDLCRRRPGPPRRPAHRLSRHRRPALLGTQDQERPRQGPQTPPRRRQEGPAQDHERTKPAQGALSRAPLHRTQAGNLPQGRRLPAKRPRRPAHMLPIQNPRRAQTGQNHKRHRTALPRSPAPNPAHGNLPGQNLNGPHPLRRLHPRKPKPGSPYPLLPDTQFLTLPARRAAGIRYLLRTSLVYGALQSLARLELGLP